MSWALKIKKSAGVAVTNSVHKMIQKGNNARDAGQWAAAADFYSAVVAEDPELFHIWIQLGHALKQADKTEAAEAAYLRAAELRPGSGEPLLHLGHLYKVGGDRLKAARSYYDATKADPKNADAVSELNRIVAHSTGVSREHLTDLLEQVLHDESNGDFALQNAAKKAQLSLAAVIDHLPDAAQAETLRSARALLEAIERATGEPRGVEEGAAGRAALIFDASDLIGYYTHARLPTGIQRVQIEAITSALRQRDRIVRICCFIDGRDDWLEVPVGQFFDITQLSVRSGERNDQDWVTALNKLHLTLALAQPFEFPDGAYLINLGTSWWLHNYFLFVRHAKAKHGIRYIPFVHDFIPIMAPEHCVKGLTQDFISWAVGVFEHANHFLVNSHATKRDLIRVAEILRFALDPDDVAVIQLDADFRKPETRRLGRADLAKWRLDEDPFVLMVSTIESRKGHVVAMDAWLELIRRHGARATPKLVCVGKNGWLNDTVYQRLAQNDELAKRVTMLSYLSDDELALLYRSCQFTIYPSLYEGWGLPITESLCYGKPVIASDSSSLPEAGGPFAVYVETGSSLQLADAVEKMSTDTVYRAALEAKIAAEFEPRTWRDVAHHIDREIVRLTGHDESGEAYRAPRAKLGAYHPITRNIETRIWPGIGSGEIFRTGLGWLWPDTWGCWTRPQGGGLAIGLPEERGALRVYLLLQNFPNHECPWRLRIKGLPTLRGTLRNGEQKWISFDYPVLDDAGVLRMDLRGEWSESIRMATSGTEKEYMASVGLRGFFICEVDDATSRTAFLEAAALGNVEELSAYRETVQPASSDDGWEE